MSNKLYPKLSVHYYGPYLVLKQAGEVNFKLQLSQQARIHLVFYASQLKAIRVIQWKLFSSRIGRHSKSVHPGLYSRKTY